MRTMVGVKSITKSSPMQRACELPEGNSNVESVGEVAVAWLSNFQHRRPTKSQQQLPKYSMRDSTFQLTPGY